MGKLFLSLLGATALSIASTANAATVINLTSLPGDLGDDHVYTAGILTLTASGYSAANIDEHLFAKTLGGNETGLGLVNDSEHEIAGAGFIQLDVSPLFGLVSSLDFFMNSVAGAEGWAVYGSNIDAAGKVGGVLLISGSDEGIFHTLPNFGQYDFYNFFATGPTGSNVLLGGLSATAAVPEPGTWAMMLFGFGAVGFALRRRRKQASLGQLA